TVRRSQRKETIEGGTAKIEKTSLHRKCDCRLFGQMNRRCKSLDNDPRQDCGLHSQILRCRFRQGTNIHEGFNAVLQLLEGQAQETGPFPTGLLSRINFGQEAGDMNLFKIEVGEKSGTPVSMNDLLRLHRKAYPILTIDVQKR